MLPDDERGENNCALDAVIVVNRPNSLSRKLVTDIIKSTSSPNKERSSTYGIDRRTSHSCRCRHGDGVRQRHNATQTPDAILSCSHMNSCQRHRGVALECCNKNFDSCSCVLNGDLKPGDITCHCHITHHCQRYSASSVGGGSGDGKEKKNACQTHGHGCRSYKDRHSYHQNCHHLRHQQMQRHHKHSQQHHHHHHYRHVQQKLQKVNANFNVHQLPSYNSKSSYDSSDDMQQQSRLDTQQERLQEIAIEIDAATMTEGNTSTATSNFAYKMAMGNVAPIIMAPLHGNYEDGDGSKKYRQKRSRRRCDSINSNSTAVTDELARSNHGEGNYEEGDLYHTNIRTGLIKTDNRYIQHNITSPHLICCDDSQCCFSGDLDCSKKYTSTAHNECVKIRRKRFKASAADDCCSTCSHCYNCSCQNADATSCSSFDDLDADEDNYDNEEERQITRHELVVAAECHRCNLQRKSTSSTGEEADADADEDGNGDGGNDSDEKLTTTNMAISRPPKRFIRDNTTTTTNSSTHTSRRSSASYCSCHSSTCCCCECNCRGDAPSVHDDDDDCESTTTGQMRTALDISFTALTSAAADFDAEHSSTLTPLTNASSSVVSTPGAEDADVTLRSLNNTLTEEVGSSSLSQSGEYFSLSSNNQQSQKMSPADTPLRKSHKLHNEGGCSDGAECKPNSKLVESNEDETVATSRKPCKHYIKHHRHKRSTSPLDGYL